MACPTPGGRGSTRPARTSGSGSLPDPMRVACRAGGRRRTARRRAGSAEFVPGLHAGRPRTRLRVRPDLADGAGTRTHAPGLRCGLPDDVRRLRCMSGRGAGAMRGCGRGAPSRAMVRPAARLRCWRDRGSVAGDSGVTRRRCGRRCRRVDAGSRCGWAGHGHARCPRAVPGIDRHGANRSLVACERGYGADAERVRAAPDRRRRRGRGRGAVRQRLRPSNAWISSVRGSTPSRQRRLIANVSLPSRSAPRPNGATPQTGQNWCRMWCLLNV